MIRFILACVAAGACAMAACIAGDLMHGCAHALIALLCLLSARVELDTHLLVCRWDDLRAELESMRAFLGGAQ